MKDPIPSGIGSRKDIKPLRLHPGTPKKFPREYHRGERMGPGIHPSIAKRPRTFSKMDGFLREINLPSFPFLGRDSNRSINLIKGPFHGRLPPRRY
jgi:hypothetical protein